MKLSDAKIRTLRPKVKPYRVADGRGLCLQINPTGGCFWRYRYRFHGKAQMLTLGEYPDVGLQTARKLALTRFTRIKGVAILELSQTRWRLLRLRDSIEFFKAAGIFLAALFF